MKIGIINNSIGNVASVQSALQFYHYDAQLITRAQEIFSADLLILAGVGNFSAAVAKLKLMQLWKALHTAVEIEHKPVIGICLGMQLFADYSYENGKTKGFGWIPGTVVKIADPKARVPHIGWSEIKPSPDRIFAKLHNHFFYFVHSYHLLPENRENIIATVKIGQTEYAAAVRQKNIIGVQFHPEKSQAEGLRLLQSMIETVRV